MTTRLQLALLALIGAVLLIANIAHPLLHHLEGGSLDAILVYLNASAAQLGSTPAASR